MPAILGRSRIQPAPGLLSWLAHSLAGVAVGCDGPSPSGSALAERQSLTGHSRLAVAFLRSCWAVMKVDLIVPASSSPDKTRRGGRVVLNSSLPVSMHVRRDSLTQQDQQDKRGARARVYAQTRQSCTSAQGTLMAGPLIPSSQSTPSCCEASVGARPQTRRHARAVRTAPTSRENTRRLATRGARLRGQDVLTVKMRSTTPCLALLSESPSSRASRGVTTIAYCMRNNISCCAGRLRAQPCWNLPPNRPSS